MMILNPNAQPFELKKKPTLSWVRKLPVVPYKKKTTTPYLTRPLHVNTYQVYPPLPFGSQPWFPASVSVYPPFNSYPVNKTMVSPPFNSYPVKKTMVYPPPQTYSNHKKNYSYIKHYPKSNYIRCFRYPPQKSFGYTQKKYRTNLPNDPFHEQSSAYQRPEKKSPSPPPVSVPKRRPNTNTNTKTVCNNNFKEEVAGKVQPSSFYFDEFNAQLHGWTTVMVKNIPNKIRMKLFLSYLNKHCIEDNRNMKKNEENCSEYDFVYLPMDFKTNLNLGYAFINFTNSVAAVKFYRSYNNLVWANIFSSPKICEITRARIQGKQELEKHFQKSSFPCTTDDYLPTSFSPPCNGENTSVSLPRAVGRRQKRY